MAQTLKESNYDTVSVEDCISGPIEIILAIRNSDRSYRKAMKQIAVLNRRIKAIETRYSRAFKAGQGAFLYQQRLLLLTLEGVRDVMLQYAMRQGRRLDVLEDELKEKYDIDMDDYDDDF